MRKTFIAKNKILIVILILMCIILFFKYLPMWTNEVLVDPESISEVIEQADEEEQEQILPLETKKQKHVVEILVRHVPGDSPENIYLSKTETTMIAGEQVTFINNDEQRHGLLIQYFVKQGEGTPPKQRQYLNPGEQITLTLLIPGEVNIRSTTSNRIQGKIFVQAKNESFIIEETLSTNEKGQIITIFPRNATQPPYIEKKAFTAEVGDRVTFVNTDKTPHSLTLHYFIGTSKNKEKLLYQKQFIGQGEELTITLPHQGEIEIDDLWSRDIKGTIVIGEGIKKITEEKDNIIEILITTREGDHVTYGFISDREITITPEENVIFINHDNHQHGIFLKYYTKEQIDTPLAQTIYIDAGQTMIIPLPVPGEVHIQGLSSNKVEGKIIITEKK